MMSGISKELKIFGNGTVRYANVTGLRLPLATKVTLTWVDKLSDEGTSALVRLFKENRFEELSEKYEVRGSYILRTPRDQALMRVSISHEDMVKEVTVYVSPYWKQTSQEESVSEPPETFSDIAKRLLDVIQKVTTETQPQRKEVAPPIIEIVGQLSESETVISIKNAGGSDLEITSISVKDLITDQEISWSPTDGALPVAGERDFTKALTDADQIKRFVIGKEYLVTVACAGPENLHAVFHNNIVAEGP